MSLYDDYWARLGSWNDIVDHMPFLHHVARYQGTVIELGVRDGNSTLAFLSALQAHGGHLWSCDVAAPSVPSEWATLECWTFVPGDDLAPAVQAALPDHVGAVFIDTSHDFAHTLAELRAYAPRATGFVLAHDTQWAPGNQALPEANGPVAQALDAYCAETGLKWENRHSEQGLFGLGVMSMKV